VAEHWAFESVAAMLAPEALSAILGRSVAAVREVPLGPQESAYSGSAITAIETDAGRLFLKRVSRRWDYFMRVSDDRHGREAAIWADGLLDRLPPEMAHVYLAVARDGDGWAILMRDVGPALTAINGNITSAQHERIVTALVATHAAYWDLAPIDYGCDPWHHYHVVSPDAALRDTGPRGPMHAIISDGWEKLVSLLDPGIASQVLGLANDPTPLVTALAPLPQTLTHADARPANIGIDGETVVLIDWALAGRDVAGLDIVWYVAGAGSRCPTSREDALALYERELAARLGPRLDQCDWAAIRDLSLLGGLLRHGWIAARVAYQSNPAQRDAGRADVAWWQEAARAGLGRI